MKDEPQIRPFSNGSHATDWYGRNCQRCVKAYFPQRGVEYPADESMKQYVRIGKECEMKYYIDWSFVTSEIPKRIYNKIGLAHGPVCKQFSELKKDRYKPEPRKPKTDDKQMEMNFL